MAARLRTLRPSSETIRASKPVSPGSSRASGLERDSTAVAMKARPFEELKWDVPTPDLLRELSTSSLPLRLRSSETHRSFYRDLYFDTADGSLSRRGIICRWRVGADDRRTLSVSFPGSPLVASEVPETDPVAAFAGGSEAARRLRGGADPAALQVLTELEVERLTRDARSPWPWGGRFALMYDAVSVRRSGIVRGFQELKLRRVDPGVPSLERIGEAIGAAPGLRAMIETKLARAQRLTANLEREATRTRHRVRADHGAPRDRRRKGGASTDDVMVSGCRRGRDGGVGLPASASGGAWQRRWRPLLPRYRPRCGDDPSPRYLGRPTDPPGPGHAE